MRENKFAQDMSRLLKKQGAIVASYVASQWGVSGFPDKIVVHRLWSGFIELKIGSRQVTAVQRLIIDAINRRQPWTAIELREVYHDNKKCAVHLNSKIWEIGRGDLLTFLGEKYHEARADIHTDIKAE